MALPRIAFELDDQPGWSLYALDIEPARFRGSRSVFGATFHLPVSLFTFPERSCRPSLFAGALCWADEPDGLAIPLQPLLFNRSELAIPVSDDQLARLDERRAGNEPRFTLHLWVSHRKRRREHSETSVAETSLRTSRYHTISGSPSSRRAASVSATWSSCQRRRGISRTIGRLLRSALRPRRTGSQQASLASPSARCASRSSASPTR